MAAQLSADESALLLDAVVELSHVRALDGVMAVVRRRARELTGADGVTFVLREGDRVFYADEDAIGPLWKGQRFAASTCVSGWAIEHRATVVIEDIYADDRVPQDAYRPTFVKSLAMVPIRREDPIGAIGAYWATRHAASAREVALLEALASASAIAVHNAELLADAHRAAVVREEFLAIASHEIRTPLTALLLQIETLERFLQRDQIDRDKLAAKLETTRRNALRLDDLLERMLDASRMLRGAMVIVQGRVDLAGVVRGVIDQLAEEAARAGCDVQRHLPETLSIAGDAEHLGVIASNLLANAIKYGPGRPIEIELERLGTEGARLSVRDHGIGIDEKDQARIFDPFERAVSTRNYGGFGVGLWAARKMAEAHGGRIDVRSTPGRGAMFIVELGAAGAAPSPAE